MASPSPARGCVRGHRAGVGSPRLLGYQEARHQIYLPLYRWVLEHRVQDLVDRLRLLAAQQPVVLLDYATNGDVDDLNSPLSHAALVKAYAEGAWPEECMKRLLRHEEATRIVPLARSSVGLLR